MGECTIPHLDASYRRTDRPVRFRPAELQPVQLRPQQPPEVHGSHRHFLNGRLDLVSNVFLTFVGLGVCATMGPWCAVAFGIATLVFNVTSAVADQTPFLQAVGVNLLGVVRRCRRCRRRNIAEGGNFAMQLIGGAVSGAISAALMQPVKHGATWARTFSPGPPTAPWVWVLAHCFVRTVFHRRALGPTRAEAQGRTGPK